MTMEGQGLLDGIRERNPPHYHVALFPEAYMDHIAPLLEAERSAERVHLMAQRLSLKAATLTVAELADQPGQGTVWRMLALLGISFGLVLVIGHRPRGSPRS